MGRDTCVGTERKKVEWQRCLYTEQLHEWATKKKPKRVFNKIFVFLHLTFRISFLKNDFTFFLNAFNAVLNFKFEKKIKQLSFNMGEVIWCLRSWPEKKEKNFQERGNQKIHQISRCYLTTNTDFPLNLGEIFF